MKVLGLDLGNRTVGIAISDELKFLARGVETYRFPDKAFNDAAKYVKLICEKEPIETIVLGYPKRLDNEVGEQAQRSLDFKDMLVELTNLPVVLVDERFTSKIASDMMKEQNLKRKKRKSSIDTMAATVILQGYLDQL